MLKQPAAGASGPWHRQSCWTPCFGADALRNKRNTEAVETAPSQLVSARVVQHLPARVPPFAEVQAKVRDAWIRKAAQAQARKLGRNGLPRSSPAPLRKGCRPPPHRFARCTAGPDP